MNQSTLYRTLVGTLSVALFLTTFSQVPRSQAWTDVAFNRFAQTKLGKKLVEKVRGSNAKQARIVAKALSQASAKGAKAYATSKSDVDRLRAYEAAIDAYYVSHPDFAAAESKWRVDRIRAENELKLGHYAKVVSILKPRLNARPDEEECVDYLADAYFQLGRVDDAYYALMPSLAPEKGGMEQILVRASLAMALKGQSQAGQWEYCVNSVDHCVGDRQTILNTIPRNRDLKGLQMLSYLATGLDCDSHARSDDMTIYYLRNAIKLDPGNPVANFHIIDPLMRKGRFEEALASLERGLPRAGGRYKSLFEVDHIKLKYIVNSLKETELAKKAKSGG